jgi:regulator of nucleoside diphosphate kinase
MMKTKALYITEQDMQKLRAVIEVYGGDSADILEEKLDRARIVRSKDIPRDVITVHSVVRVKYVDTGEEHTFTLVLPGDKGETNRVSILAPTGIALLGYREKDLVEWQVPAGKRRVQIMKVVYQPERHADYNA